MDIDHSSSSDDDSWDCDDSDTVVPVLCLFCDQVLQGEDAVLEHIVTEHQFNLKGFCEKHKLDCYQYIKLINYIRKEVSFVTICLTLLGLHTIV